MAVLRMRQAIGLAIADEMRADPRVVFWGEDVAAAGGVFKTSEGLLDEFGPDRVRDTPIAETGFLGAAVGAAMTGLRPVVEIMFMDFLGVAFDQLVTQAAKMRYLSRGQFTMPLVVRGSAGMGLGYGAQHSQSVEPWFQSVPGLGIVSPSSARSAYGLLRAAIRSGDPVLVVEPRVLYGVRQEFTPDESSIIPLGRAETIRSGTEVTVAGLGSSVRTAVRAADESERSVEVLDLLSLKPWDRESVLESVARTRRLVIVEDGPHEGGWGATIAADVTTELWGLLEAPVLRVCAPDVPVPHADALEQALVPSVARVRDAIAVAFDASRIGQDHVVN